MSSEVGMNNFPYSVKVAKQHRNVYRKEDGLDVVWAWCYDTLGSPSNGVWFHTELDLDSVVHFQNEADASMFALVWA